MGHLVRLARSADGLGGSREKDMSYRALWGTSTVLRHIYFLSLVIFQCGSSVPLHP